jgi:hypothetical protein
MTPQWQHPIVGAHRRAPLQSRAWGGGVQDAWAHRRATIRWAHRRATLPALHQANLVGGEVVQAVYYVINRPLQIARVGVRIAPLPRQNRIHQ